MPNIKLKASSKLFATKKMDNKYNFILCNRYYSHAPIGGDDHISFSLWIFMGVSVTFVIHVFFFCDYTILFNIFIVPHFVSNDPHYYTLCFSRYLICDPQIVWNDPHCISAFWDPWIIPDIDLDKEDQVFSVSLVLKQRNECKPI